MRRRALLAVSTISSGSDNPWGDLPAESTTFAFPLYINITKRNPHYPEEWLRDADDLLLQFFNWIVENATIEDEGLHYRVPSELLASTKIYINGGLVEEAIYYSGNIELRGKTIPFDEVYMETFYGICGYGAKLPQGGEGTYDKIFGNIPPESAQFGWPLYITVPYLNDEGYMFTYRKEDDEVVSVLLDWANTNYVVTDEMGDFLKFIEAYPPELYVNGVKIITMSNEIEAGRFMGWQLWPESREINGYNIFDITIEDNVISIEIDKLL